MIGVTGTNIYQDAFWNSGNWTLSNISLDTVTGNGIVSLGGITKIYGASISNITGSPFVEDGGQIVLE